ncbi:MAG: acyl-CoA dehydrogenase domain-containing protein, partial [Alphaproteobacteria bacterium]|nr:acyl-CoA dehydrogenase domain-containing protein [Alphaproteobacteria bacterium]
WKMLMESLAAGRSISLPSQAQSAAELALRAASAYGGIREQFGLEIGKFEGIKEKLSSIAGHAYVMNSARRLAFGAVDAGEKPSVISAIVKAYLTEGARKCINDAMDIHAGAAICRGPANIYARPYNAIPIGITVEGANILTRSLIVFGQGAIRCHPFILQEMQAVQTKDVSAFDKAFFGHLKHVLCTIGRALFHQLTLGLFLSSPVSGAASQHYKKVNRYTLAFALIADICLATLGGSLKRKEYLSGRLSDAFAWLFLISAALKDFHDKNSPEAERPLLEWTCRHGFCQIEQALIGVLDNLPNRPIAGLTKIILFGLSKREKPVSDRLRDAIVDSLNNPSIRRSLTSNVYIPSQDETGLGNLEATYSQVQATAAIRKKIITARKSGKIAKSDRLTMAKNAYDQGIITELEFREISEAEALRKIAIEVASFTPQDHKGVH